MELEKGLLVRLPPPPGVQAGPTRPKKRSGGDDDLWLVSYGDLLTLLFCFFTLLLSVSSVDASKMDGLKSQIDHQFGENTAVEGLAALRAQIQEVAAKAGLSQDIHVRQTEQGLVVDLNARILFPPAGAELSEDAMTLLDALAGPLTRQAIEIQVEGHTDPVPIQNSRFASNWELSSARATGVVRYLIDVLEYSPQRLRAVGRADTVPVDAQGELLAAPAPRSEWNEAYLARQRRVTLVLRPVVTVPATVAKQ